MQKQKILPHFLSIPELAALIDQPPDLIYRSCRSSLHPPWLWRERWREPRFALETLPEWLRIVGTVDLDSLPENPPALERPVDVFSDSRRKRRERKAELETILKCFPQRMAAKLRAEA